MHINILEKRIGYVFINKSLLEKALSHRSMGKNNNERLEFLGDSLLSLIITQTLFTRFPEAREGDMSRFRASLVKGETLAELAREFELGDFLRLGEGELKSGGFRRASILADAVEAIIGAIYCDAGIDVCDACVLGWFSDRLSRISLESVDKDPKTRLQEYLQDKRLPLPHYDVVEATGKSHEMNFVVRCRLEKPKKVCDASDSSKRGAQKKAAEQMLSLLGLN
ncbi:MAG: ribonuclease III [Alteromonadaceae bacterium]|nr:MAG: ribonuclease III [Alteromonadaceae bacterium]